MKLKDTLTRLVRNAGLLLAGNTGSSLLGLFSLIAMARSLGPEQLGTLAVIQAYASTMSVLFNFQSWHTIVKFGSDALARSDAREFERLIRFGSILDASSAIVGAVVAALVAVLVGPHLGWDESSVRLAALFCISIALDISGTPKAVLRLFDRFGQLAAIPVILATVKLGAVLLAAYSDAGLAIFLAITAATIVLNHLLLFACAWRLLRERGHGGALRRSTRAITREHPEIWRFVWTTNVSSSFGIVTKEFDIVLVGSLLGNGAAGLYRVARQFASLLSRPLEALYHAAYPELTRLWAHGEFTTFRSVMLRGGMAAGGAAFLIWCALWLWGDVLLGFAIGSSYGDALPVLLWYALALVVGVFAFALEPAGYAMGLPRQMLAAQAASTLLYLVILPPLLFTQGLVGAGVSALIFQSMWAIAMWFVQDRARRNET